MTTKLLEALTLAQEALGCLWNQEKAEKALAAIWEQKAELEKQEPAADYFDFGLEEVEDYLRNCCNSPFMADKLSEIRKSISEPFAYAFSKNETWLFSLFEQPDSIPLYAAPFNCKGKRCE